MKRYVLIVVALLLIVLAGAEDIRAQGGDEYPPGVDPDQVYEISREMYCDVCQGVPLADCPSTQCRVWREEIAVYLSEGRTEDEIRTVFANRYGDKVSGTAVDDGDKLFTYLMPAGAFLLLLLGIVVIIRRWDRDENTNALQAAQEAGTLEGFDRPVPDNVDLDYLERFMRMLEEKS
jgi:cytochrome c-type biogenesis protein CcmH/NrfF